MRLRRKVLLIIAGAVAVLLAFASYAEQQVRATAAERSKPLPGDNLIPNPIGAVNHAITIHRAPHDVWPWLAQMGSSRAGWYSYDFIDNGGRRSAERIVPEFQNVTVGSVFPALPGAKDVFVVVQFEPERSLVLSWRLPDGRYQTTWAFVLEQPQPDQTRLISSCSANNFWASAAARRRRLMVASSLFSDKQRHYCEQHEHQVIDRP